MKYIISILLFSLFSTTKTFGQFYTAAEITQIATDKSASEGDFYLDTINNNYYIGLTHGVLTEVGLDSAGIAQIVSNTLLDENDLGSDSPTQGATQQSIKHYVDSLAGPSTQVSNELFFDGKSHANSVYHDFYYVSVKVDAGYCVIRYNKNDVNEELTAESVSDPQPTTLNVIVALTYN